MKLEGIMLNKISQSWKDKYCLIPLAGATGALKSVEAESRMVVVG